MRSCSGEKNVQKKLKFDPTIDFGHLLTFVTVLIAALALYFQGRSLKATETELSVKVHDLQSLAEQLAQERTVREKQYIDQLDKISNIYDTYNAITEGLRQADFRNTAFLESLLMQRAVTQNILIQSLLDPEGPNSEILAYVYNSNISMFKYLQTSGRRREELEEAAGRFSTALENLKVSNLSIEEFRTQLATENKRLKENLDQINEKYSAQFGQLSQEMARFTNYMLQYLGKKGLAKHLKQQ